MKGLWYKDLCILKKQLLSFLTVSCGVVVLGVAFFYSAEYGNVALLLEKASAENPKLSENMVLMYKTAICLVLMIPLAHIAVVTECFKEDRTNHFGKVAGSLPISNTGLVLNRYLLVLGISLAAMAFSAVSAFLILGATDMFTAPQLFSYIICFWCLFLMHVFLIIPLFYGWGTEKANIIDTAPVALLGIVVFCFMGKMMSMNEQESERFLRGVSEMLLDILEHRAGMVCLIMMAVGLLSFGLSLVLKQGRGKGKS